eukprot:6005560-Heterocapsa_arctica.AAC.1
MTTAQRLTLKRVLKHKRTPPDFENLGIAWQGAPESGRLAVEAMANADLLLSGRNLVAGDTGSASSVSGPPRRS